MYGSINRPTTGSAAEPGRFRYMHTWILQLLLALGYCRSFDAGNHHKRRLFWNVSHQCGVVPTPIGDVRYQEPVGKASNSWEGKKRRNRTKRRICKNKFFILIRLSVSVHTILRIHSWSNDKVQIRDFDFKRLQQHATYFSLPWNRNCELESWLHRHNVLAE